MKEKMVLQDYTKMSSSVLCASHNGPNTILHTSHNQSLSHPSPSPLRSSKSVAFTGSHPHDGQSNYIKRLNEDARTSKNSAFHNSLPLRPRMTLIDRISRRGTRQRSVQGTSQVRLHGGTFRCPKVVRPVPSVLPAAYPYPVQSLPLVEGRGVEASQRVGAKLLLDRMAGFKSPPIEKKRSVSNSYRVLRPKEEKRVTSVKIIIENAGNLQTKSIKELLKDYANKVQENK
eukprot:TRINITY_DN1258_c0_g1_i2.p1 TRINITY_DN1258_c0_g1~~TRINITY_DN1258_c0_g1_i2.p1  ORF type:complete len:230 (-),score=29.54 TRINITY_DN1258_c0_g1_i2:171-860(-)